MFKDNYNRRNDILFSNHDLQLYLNGILISSNVGVLYTHHLRYKRATEDIEIPRRDVRRTSDYEK